MDQLTDTDLQVSNKVTRVPLRHVADVCGAGALARVLAHAGDDRPVETLLADDGHSSYAQFRRLIEACAEELGGLEGLTRVGESDDMASGAMLSATEVLQLLRSPHALFESLPGHTELGFCRIEVDQTGPSEWLIVMDVLEGYEPFEAFCALNLGVLRSMPGLFGYVDRWGAEETCVLRGDDECRFRIGWADTDQEGSERLALRQRISMLERRLQQFQSTVASLVLADDLDSALDQVIDSFALLVRAPGFVLAIEPIQGLDRWVYAHGVDQVEAERVGALVLAGEPCAEIGDRVTDITSTRRYYGRLAVYDAEGEGFADVGLLTAYARLAATALDAASAVDETRREVARGRALLELSATLADVTTVEAMAQSLARATPVVVGADTATVTVADRTRGLCTVLAVDGFSPEATAFMVGYELPISDVGSDILYLGRDTLDGSGYDPDRMTGVACCVVPISLDGQVAAWLTASVNDDAARLAPSVDLEARLRGLAAQASSAVRNARLVEQIRHQALHDPLTGLPNRALVLDRAEAMLARGRRDGTPVSALFLDLDGFKAINDTMGHDAGDQLLQTVAARLGSVVRQCDTLARLGGDEFVVLVTGADVAIGPLAVAQRLLDEMRKPFVLEGWADTPLSVTTSIGIATVRDGSSSAGELLRDADLALYRAKAAGRNCVMTHTPDMAAESGI